MTALRLSLATGLALALLAPGSATGEMYKYVDAQGRTHFTQDIGQVPPEYRNQVERKELRRKISVTGEGGARANPDRVRAMQRRSRQLQNAAGQRQRQQAVPAARRRNTSPLAGAKEPRKYSKDCSDYHRTGRCRKTVTAEWQRWNAANGGDNGEPDLRRKINQR